ncbi:hypothetical protein C5535_08295 [Campylobacter jejuni]|nr:hypothetical protein [Campylobacter jejuni]
MNKIKKEDLKNYSEFLRKIILDKNSYFEDKDIMEICTLAKKEKSSIRSFIRNKLGFDAKKTEYNYNSSKNESLITYLSMDDKDKINKILEESAFVSLRAYCYNKILFHIQTMNLFSFEEIIEIKKQAQNYSLEEEEYLKLKIKNN